MRDSPVVLFWPCDQRLRSLGRMKDGLPGTRGRTALAERHSRSCVVQLLLRRPLPAWSRRGRRPEVGLYESVAFPNFRVLRIPPIPVDPSLGSGGRDSRTRIAPVCISRTQTSPVPAEATVDAGFLSCNRANVFSDCSFHSRTMRSPSGRTCSMPIFDRTPPERIADGGAVRRKGGSIGTGGRTRRRPRR